MRDFRRVALAGGVFVFTSILAITVGGPGIAAGVDENASTSASPYSAARPGDDLMSRTRTMVGSADVGITSFGEVAVSCPPGTVALGGGVDVGSLQVMEIFSSSPTFNGSRLNTLGTGTYSAPDGWFGGTYHGTDAFSRPMKVAAICVPLTGVTTVVTSLNVNPSAFWWAKAVCPAGKAAVGGGVDVEDHLLMVVTSSGPTIAGARPYDVADGSYGAPDGWWGTVRNNSTDTIKTFEVAVVCQPLGGISSVLASDQAASGGGTATKRASCPAGSIATGGGVDSSQVYWDYVSETAPRFEQPAPTLMHRDPGLQPAPIGWNASIRNDTSVEQTLKVAAVCARWPMVFFGGDDSPSPDDRETEEEAEENT